MGLRLDGLSYRCNSEACDIGHSVVVQVPLYVYASSCEAPLELLFVCLTSLNEGALAVTGVIK